MKKAFLFIAALAMSVSLSAEKITTVAGITSGNQYYVGATTGDKDYYFYVDGSAKTESIKGVAKEDVADAVALTFTAVTDGWTIQFDNGLYLGIKNAKDNGAVQVMEEAVVWKIEENTDKGLLKLHPNDYYLQKNNSGIQFGSYKNTQTDVWLESAGAAPTPATLDSIVIKGKAEKMEYEVGEAFDPAGLEVWGIYTKTVKGDSTSQIKSGITWTLDPETFEEASDNASVTMVASYKELTTADTTITGINVKAVVPKMDVTFNFIENLYGHKGVSSGSGEDYVSDGDIAVGEKFNEDPAQIEFTVNGSTQTRFWDASNKHELRLYKGAEFVLSIAGDYKIIKVEFTGSAVNLESNGVTVSDKVWEGDAAKSVTFVNTATGSKINSIKVTYIAAAPAVANPTITADSVFNVYWNPITVTLACETEGAAIYYTIDGSEPTASATKYDAPFSVTATTTVKAIAIKSGLDNSEVVSKTFTFGTVFASLEELVANQPATDDVAYVQVTITNAEIDSFYVSTKGYTNGIFVTANGTAVELYTNDVPETWEAGGKVSGTIKAEWLLYKGTPELQKWDGGWEAFTYKAPGEPTGLQQVMMQGNIRKAMVNGRLIIVKGEKAFDLQGRIVK